MAILLASALTAALETSALMSQDDSKGTGRVDCASRRGLGECRSLGVDCQETPIVSNGAQSIKIEFPMLLHKVYFPCETGFSNVPFVLTSIEGANNNKLYAHSIRNTTTDYFTINVQRVDDVDEPDMHCSDYKVCYIAIVP